MKKINKKQLLFISMLTIGSLSEITECAPVSKPSAAANTNLPFNGKPNPDVATMAKDSKELLSTKPARVEIKEKKQHLQDTIDVMQKEAVDCDHERSALYKELEKIQKKLSDNFDRKLSINDKLLTAYKDRNSASQEIVNHDKKVAPLYQKLEKDAAVIAQ